MSRTSHTTPSFPRTLRGPRGGRHIAPTPCVECVSFTSCRPGTCSAPYGCESWVDEDGRRVDIFADLDPQPVDLAELDTPDPEDPNPYVPSSATLSEMSGIFPTDDNAPEPDGGRFTFETMGGLVKGKCGPADLIEDALPKIAAVLDANSEPLDADRPGSIAHRLIELNDPGPLFGGQESN